jgi:hypothetical protein
MQEFTGKLWKNDGAQNHGPRFAPAYAIKLRMGISQKPFYARIGKNPGAKSKEKSLRRLCASLHSRNSH